MQSSTFAILSWDNLISKGLEYPNMTNRTWIENFPWHLLVLNDASKNLYNILHSQNGHWKRDHRAFLRKLWTPIGNEAACLSWTVRATSDYGGSTCAYIPGMVWWACLLPTIVVYACLQLYGMVGNGCLQWYGWHAYCLQLYTMVGRAVKTILLWACLPTIV